jgi:hypothetical protein
MIDASRTYLGLNEFLAEMFGNEVLHGIGDFVRPKTFEKHYLLEVIQTVRPFFR